MKLLTFLGTTPYWKTTYIWRDNPPFETEFIAEAIVNWLRPQDIVVFLTEEAELHDNWKQLQQRLEGQNVHSVRIPNGWKEPEVWEIFDKVVAQVQKGDSIVLDITHAFRSLPMLLTVAAAFLRAIHEVSIEHIFYAPSERKQQESAQEPAQGLPKSEVIDLILLLHWLDWMEAARRFKETGDARWIGETLMRTHDTLHTTGTGEPRSLKKAGRELRNLAQALHLARAVESAQVAERLKSILPETSQEISKWARPFELLLDEVTEQTSRLAYPHPETLNGESLQKQLDFIQQLLAYGLVMQAAQAAREWVVNWAIWYKAGRSTLPKEQWLHKKLRDRVEHELNTASPPEGDSSCQLLWLDNPQLSDLLKQLWPRSCDLRNDLAHCGMRLNPLSAQDLRQQTEKYLQILRDVMALSGPE